MVITCALGCKKMEDKISEFIKDGETIYIAKADSIKARGGNERIELSWLLLSDPKVTNYKIYWNSRQDSVGGAVTKSQDVDTVRVTLNGMVEGTYYFEIFMFDKDGNASIPATAIGRVYGEQYQASLLGRTYRGMTRVGEGVEIDWMPAQPSLVGVEVKYRDSEGGIVEHIVPQGAELDTLQKFPPNGDFQYRSMFKPDSNALDVFYTEYESGQITNDLLDVSAVSFSSSVQYGAQEDQLTVLLSSDFNGKYDADNVQAATWIDITDAYPLAAGTSRTPWGPKDFSEFKVENKPMYIAFMYVFDPEKSGSQRNWLIRDFELTSVNGEVIANLPESGFTLVHEGAVEPGRSTLSSTTITLRGNASNTETKTVTWAISKALF
ncbi:protein of unknown function [Parapedobacter composti]|uniref:DUF5017 domain-containing protein n=2 Tax=Parapedobacter composti TaxID=623281 RepID=A0A1I1EBL0_9SPHI|nr:protein of unknown function [Parapedobacter composti]